VSHLNFKAINRLVLSDHVRGLPLLKFDNEHLFVACEQGKQSRKGHMTLIDTKINKPPELLQFDLCGPFSIERLGGNKYILVIVDDYSCFSWVYFLRYKYQETCEMINFIKYVELELKRQVRRIRTDN